MGWKDDMNNKHDDDLFGNSSDNRFDYVIGAPSDLQDQFKSPSKNHDPYH